MWYKVPETKPKPYEPSKPIFPWEREPSRPKPTRIFAEDNPPSPTPAPAPAPAPAPEVSEFEASPPPPSSTEQEYNYQGPGAPRTKPTRVWRDELHVSTSRTAEESWNAFAQNSANAWDSVPGIDSYVRSIMDQQTKRGKVQVLNQASGTDDIGSPTISRKERRESLILTDFPSAVERPSLPVTPAPIRRPTFWGEERDETGELPAAQGVPEQSEWVCPQCGFSSAHASDFARRRGSFASVSKHVKSIADTVASVIDAPGSTLPEARPVVVTQVELPLDEVEEAVKDALEEAAQDVPEEVEKESQIPPTSDPDPRNGLSPSGVPLASLTNPSLFSTRSWPALC